MSSAADETRPLLKSPLLSRDFGKDAYEKWAFEKRSALALKRVVIVGGGISGLAAAHRLCELRQERGLELSIQLLEATDRLGGLIETRKRDGFLLEAGADAFLTERPWGADLARRIGLADELIPTRQEFRRSWIVRQGRLVPVPEGMVLMAPVGCGPLFKNSLVSWRGKARMFCEPFIPPRRDEADESVAQFIRRRFGREALERIGGPMVGGIYGADPERLSLQATLPRFYEMERRHGSVMRALRAGSNGSKDSAARAAGPRYGLFLTLRGGMQRLVETLAARMPEVALKTGAAVLRLERAGARWKIFLRNGESLEADSLCLALPAHRAAELLRPAAPELSEELAQIPYESVATVNLAFREGALARPARGFGFVRPPSEKGVLIGCTFSSVKFPGRAPEGSLLLRAFIGGARAMEENDGALQRNVLEELTPLLGLREQPLFCEVRRYPKGMPQYPVGHPQRLAAIERQVRGIPGLFLVGNGYRGVGIPDCIRRAEQAAEEIIHRHCEARRAEAISP